METVRLSDYSSYDKNKGGIQKLRHKFRNQILEYWGEDIGILIGITPTINMKTRIYEGIRHGDWVRCTQCGAQMLLPCGADQCPECYGYDTLVWVDEDRQEMNVEHLDCLVQIRKLELQDYLSPDVLEIENNEYYK